MSSRRVHLARSLGFIAVMLDAVSTKPGATAFTRILASRPSRASVWCQRFDCGFGTIVGHHIGLRAPGAREVNDAPASALTHVGETPRESKGMR